MSSKLNLLLSSEENARELVEEATREARRIRTGISAKVSSIEKEYKSELQKFERKGMDKVHEVIAVLTEEQKAILEKGKTSLESRSIELAPRSLELIRSAIEGEKG